MTTALNLSAALPDPAWLPTVPANAARAAQLTESGAAPFHPELLRIIFDGNYETVHMQIREVLFDPLFASQADLSLNQSGRLSYARSRLVHRRLARPLELLGNPQRLFALAEWPGLLDVACFSLLMVHYNLCLGTVFDHGNGRADIADLTGELDDLSCFGPYMATELGYGNNVAALRTEAVYDHASRSFALNTPDALAQKYMSYSGFTDIPKIAVVMARLVVDGADCGVFPFLVRLATATGLCPGIRTVPCPEKPVQGLDNGLTWFDHVRVPLANILMGSHASISADGKFCSVSGNSRTRFLRAMSRIVPGRLCVASAATGLGRASVYLALRFAQHRMTNAPGNHEMPVLAYRSHQRDTFTALAKVYAMTLLVNHAKRAFLAPAGVSAPGVANLINIVKAVSTWEMADVVTVCRERCGAQGIFSANRIVDYGLLLPGLITAEGDNQVLLASTAAQMLAQPWPGEVPARPDPDAACLSDPVAIIALLHYREHQSWLAARAAKEQAADKGYVDAWNDVANGAIEMTRLHGVRVALQQLHAAAADSSGADVCAALGLLAVLFGISELQRDSGWYLAHELMRASDVLDLPGAADRVCAALYPHVTLLLDGFALTPELLRAPMAFEDYAGEFCRQAREQAQDQSHAPATSTENH